ncbi:MAG: hypothetical protein ACK4UO_06160 [Pseudolabrys sp.]
MSDILVMSQADYARHRGVKKQAVHKRMAKLREAGAVLADGKIDVAAADLAWPNTIERVNTPADAPFAPVGAAREDGGAGALLTRARAAGAVYTARMDELKFGVASGKYVAARGIAGAASLCGEKGVRAVRTLRSKAEVLNAAAIQNGLAGVRLALAEIEYELLNTISDAFAQLASEAARAAAAAAEDDSEADAQAESRTEAYGDQT